MKSSSRKSIWNSTWMYVLVGALLMVSAILFFSVAKPLEMFSGYKPSLEFFYLKNCGHCKDFSPIWGQAVKDVKADASIADKIDLKDYDINDAQTGGAARAAKYNITAAPTVLYIYGPGPEEYVEYDGSRTADAILAFVKARLLTPSS